MTRTTLDIDDPVLRDLKRLGKKTRKSLGRLVSDLLAEALAALRRKSPPPTVFAWHSRDMGARFDLADKDRLYSALDERDEA